jgi:polyribonucleotide nucleotidyltransferase
MIHSTRIQLGKEELIFETGALARQADAAIKATYGGTVVLLTCVIAKELNEESDFFPLTVEYQEKTYAAGKIPGGFFKREGRPSEREILTARLIDRPIRPLFLKGFYNEVQIMGIVLSSDGENDPDIVAINAASQALLLANLAYPEAKKPFTGPLAAVRVGRSQENFIINPTYSELENSDLDLVVTATKSGIIMLEAGAKQVSEDLLVKAIDFAYGHILELLKLQESFQQKVAQSFDRPLRQVDLKLPEPALLEKVRSQAEKRISEVVNISQKEKREEKKNQICDDLIKALAEEQIVLEKKDSLELLSIIIEERLRKMILEEGQRVGGRKFDEIRQVNCQIGVLPRTHGSSLFTRGETQSLCVTTLGTRADEQLIEALEGEMFKNFMLHYSFPPFSVGEIKPIRGPGRREIGHGALAERALQPVMPAKDKFPYTVRVVSEILESNGSSSMATVCAASMSLMDAGVPIAQPVAGIAMGLVKEGERYAILTDIIGLEDHCGDMDFKVTGTQDGITALQVDFKIAGVPNELIDKILAQAKQARMFLLGKIGEVIGQPRQELSGFAPRITTLKIPTEKIGELIGPGGKTIRKIIAETGATIDIEDDGTVLVASNDAKAAQLAVEKVKALTEVPEIGKLYTGKIKRILNFGAFCEILPGQEGLIHISELADRCVSKVEDVVKIGDEVTVKVISIDEQGRVNLSLKQAKSSP